MLQKKGTLSWTLAAIGAGLLALSCGQDVGRERIVGPAAPAQATAETGTVTASAEPGMQAVCHYDASLDTYTTLKLSAPGATAHLTHHTQDYAGTCAVCPCFGAGDFAAAIQHCQSPQYVSYGSTCESEPGGDGVAVNQLWCFTGFPPAPPSFEYELRVDTNAHSCSRSETGTTTVTSGPLSPAEESACLRIIANNCSF